MNPDRLPKPAAAVILLRDAEPRGIEVFLCRGPRTLPHAGGSYGFPGGEVQMKDCAESLARRCRGLSAEGARAIIGAHFSPRDALGFWIAALRELYAATGILLAVTEDGAAAPMGGRFNERASAQSLDFYALLERENLYCDASRLAYFSHWQTPPQFSPCCDARFFVAPLPEGHAPVVMPLEVGHSLWCAPDRALTLFARGELPMLFPTFASLRTLADFDDLRSVLKEYQSRQLK